MKNTEYNQALVKKAQAGLVRFQSMQKRAKGLFDSVTEYNTEPTGTYNVTNDGEDAPYKMPKPPISAEETTPEGTTPDKPTNPYLRYAAGGAGVGALVGALVNLVRNKSLLSGALGGALIGGGLGAGHKYLMDNNDTYASWENNPIESGFQSGFKAFNDAKAKL